jgi:hypothetical protein
MHIESYGGENQRRSKEIVKSIGWKLATDQLVSALLAVVAKKKKRGAVLSIPLFGTDDKG